MVVALFGKQKQGKDGRGVTQMKFVRQSRKFLKLGALEVRMASDVVGAMYTDAENVMKASVTAVSPPNLICKALDFDKDTLILKAGCQATYSIHKYLYIHTYR